MTNDDFNPQQYGENFRYDDDEVGEVTKGCFRSIIFIIVTLVLLCLTLCLVGCKSTEYVEVPVVHNESHWQKDSVHTTDSIFSEKETVIMQLDSAAMAKYGIQLKNAEKAWLVKSKEMERQIQQLMQLSITKDTVRDSIPVPYPVEKKVPAELTWWQQTKMHLGGAVIWLALLVAVIWLGKKKLRL